MWARSVDTPPVKKDSLSGSFFFLPFQCEPSAPTQQFTKKKEPHWQMVHQLPFSSIPVSGLVFVASRMKIVLMSAVRLILGQLLLAFRLFNTNNIYYCELRFTLRSSSPISLV